MPERSELEERRPEKIPSKTTREGAVPISNPPFLWQPQNFPAASETRPALWNHSSVWLWLR